MLGIQNTPLSFSQKLVPEFKQNLTKLGIINEKS
jgi:hypothetical protein